ncbi:hypothetical protein D9757_004084 [Collybiopsis confluens]|uniref:GH16 domain-containing protein n=1 Tax=Collybiopsis confluens TaxID=2823264 RepID=A0A8H5MCP0_9AGAR|nr:hypothetical protein D9757_004084 [Collybiopsis confluens]
MYSSSLAVGAFISILIVGARSQGTSCNATSPCPSSAPCCSEYGFCGSDNVSPLPNAAILGVGSAYFPLSLVSSFAWEAVTLYTLTLSIAASLMQCVKTPHTFSLTNSRILTNATYFDGNASEYGNLSFSSLDEHSSQTNLAPDWVVDKGSIINTNSSGGELGLILTETNGGTRLSSTRYVHYGTITTKLKTGRWAGVVTAFITMSNIKDEIGEHPNPTLYLELENMNIPHKDWEFPGANTTTGQTNYFWQGVILCEQRAQPTGKQRQVSPIRLPTITNIPQIDWQPTSLTFSIDGNMVRTIKQSDAVNPSTGVNEYPNTPSRIQIRHALHFSLWPAGINSSAPGTIEWAGGMINWQDPDYVSAGHFYALVQSVSVKCADPQSPGPNITSYIYGANQSTDTPNIDFSNQSTMNGSGRSVDMIGLRLGLGATIVSWMAGALVVLTTVVV